MSHVYLIVVIQKLNLESQGVVKASSFLLERVLKVADILSISIPTYTLSISLLSSLLRVKQRFHTLIVRTLWFN